MVKVADIAGSFVLGPSYLLVKSIADKAAGIVIDAQDSSDLIAVRNETERQENEMRRLEAKAKVAQEMAIAARIQSAEEVQIEEYFEYAGEGKAGLNVESSGSIGLGASGSGKRISKRVYRFIGGGASDEIVVDDAE